MTQKKLQQMLQENPKNLLAMITKLNLPDVLKVLSYFHKEWQSMKEKYKWKSEINMKIREKHNRLSKRAQMLSSENWSLKRETIKLKKSLKGKETEHELRLKIEHLEAQLLLATSPFGIRRYEKYQQLEFKVKRVVEPETMWLIQNIHSN